MASYWPFQLPASFVPPDFQRKVAAFVVKRAIGQFLSNDFTYDNVDVQLATGTMKLRDLKLNVEVLNELTATIPVVVTGGRVGEISLTFPSTDLFNGDIILDVRDVMVEVAPFSEDPQNVLFKSAFSTLPLATSTADIASSFLAATERDKELDESLAASIASAGPVADESASKSAPRSDGLLLVTSLIDRILARVKVNLENITLRVVYKTMKAGAWKEFHLDLTVPNMKFFDNSGGDTATGDATGTRLDSQDVRKLLSFSGIQVTLSELKGGHVILPRSDIPDIDDDVGVAHNAPYVRSTTLLSLASGPENHVAFNVNRSRSQISGAASYHLDLLIHSVVVFADPADVALVAEIFETLADESAWREVADLVRERSSMPIPPEGHTPPGMGMSTTSSVQASQFFDAQSTLAASSVTAAGQFRRQRSRVTIAGVQSHTWTASSSPKVSFFSPSVPSSTGSHHTGKGISWRVDANLRDVRVFLLHRDSDGPVAQAQLLQACAGRGEEPQVDDETVATLLNKDHFLIRVKGVGVKGTFGAERDHVELWVQSACISDWVLREDDRGRAFERSRGGPKYTPLVFLEPREGANAQTIYSSLSSLDVVGSVTSTKSDSAPSSSSIGAHGAKVLKPALKSATSSTNMAHSMHVTWERIHSLEEGDEGRDVLLVKMASIHVHAHREIAGQFDRWNELLRRRDQKNQSNLSSSSFEQNREPRDIIEDLDDSVSKQTARSRRDVSLDIRVPHIRVWLSVVPKDATVKERESGFLVDCFALKLKNTLGEDSSSGKGLRSPLRLANRRSGMPGITDTAAWKLEVDEVGLSFFERARLNSGLPAQVEVDITPLASIYSVPRNCPIKSARFNVPTIEIFRRKAILTSPQRRVQVPVDDEDDAEDDPPAWMFKSWFDIGEQHGHGEGNSQGSDLSDPFVARRRMPGADNFDEEETFRFREQSILESKIFVDANIPSLRINISKDQLDKLVVLLNDAGLFDGPQPDDSLKRAPQQPASSPDTEADVKPSELALLFSIARIDVTWHVQNRSGEAIDGKTKNGTYTIALEDTKLFGVSGCEGKSMTYLSVDAADFTFSQSNELAALEDPLVYRTFQVADVAGRGKSVISCVITSATDSKAKTKDQQVSLSLMGLSARVPRNDAIFRDMMLFAKLPQDIVLADDFAITTRLKLTLNEICIVYQPNPIGHCGVVAIDQIKLSTSLAPNVSVHIVRTMIYGLSVLVVDNVKGTQDPINRERALESSSINGSPELKGYFQALGYAHVSIVECGEITVKSSKNVPPFLDVDVGNLQIFFDVCADSLQVVQDVVTSIGSSTTPHTSKSELPLPTTKSGTPTLRNFDPSALPDVLSDLDYNAFAPPNTPILETSSSPRELSDSQTSEDETQRQLLLAASFKQKPTLLTTSVNDRVQVSARQEALDTTDTIRTFVSEFTIIDNHFDDGISEEEKILAILQPIRTLRLRDCFITIRLYDGYEFMATRQRMFEEYYSRRRGSTHNGTSSDGPEVPDLSAQTDVDGLSVRDESELDYEEAHVLYSDSGRSRPRGDTMSTYSTSTTRARQKPQSARDLIRSRRPKIEIKVSKAEAEADSYDEECPFSFRLSFTVKDVEILDHVETSTWRKFMSVIRSNEREKEWSAPMFKADVVSVRAPDAAASDELRIKVSVLPLRLLVDGDALDVFLRFQRFLNSSSKKDASSTTTTSPPDTGSSEDGVFIQLCEIEPISIRCDFKPKRTASLTRLRGGALVEIVNLLPFSLEDAALDLRHVKVTGVKGWSRLMKAIADIWAPHILNSQIPGIVGGVTPVKSIVNLGQGVADLVLLPVQSYKQDGTIMRGLQKGAQSFARNTAMEALNLGTKLAMGAQVVLEQADTLLALSGDKAEFEDIMEDDDHASGAAISRYSEQPKDLQEGVSLAAKSLQKHLSAAAKTVLAVPTEVYESDGSQGPARAVIRAVPVAVLRPMIGAADALGKTLLGLRNTLDPDSRLKSEDKYKRK
ncbi:hypothetical protein M427DRAFT_124871 [Gonapodya prolifera JEL478]|uniref:Autophagy-related protein 2 n=1 Tax=Gonapodya prolifera (strain JEL478) TaxID=1344416 RepID=A0A139AAC4_GONPJ|nr:hypothetical protein M427DRAFT_124871 [Gonapodya prolifera JEL478]|eukprot:KXS13639.1 hypothetical protein M427DRAFT_124871 [Gonapodya prolifera JEL478]